MTQSLLKAIAYVRVSTSKQEREGSSLDSQFQEIKTFAQAKNLKIGKVFYESASARNEDGGLKRPEFKKAVELALKKNWPIIVSDIDRFSRTQETIEDFLNRNGTLWSVNNFTADQAELSARAKRAEIDGEKRSRATRKGQARYVAAGGKLGGPTQKANAASAAARKKKSEARLADFERICRKAQKTGASKPQDIAKFLNDAGFPTPRGQPWTEATVRARLNSLRSKIAEQDFAEPVTAPETMPAALSVGSSTDEDIEAIRYALRYENKPAADIDLTIENYLQDKHTHQTSIYIRNLISIGKKKKYEFDRMCKLNENFGMF